MATKYFNLTDGSLEFHENKLVIFDKAKRERISLIFLVISTLLYSTATTIKGIRLKDYENFYFGLALTLFWIIAIIIRRNDFFKVSNEYLLKDIRYVKFSINKIEGSIIARIFTKNNRQRKIKMVQENNQDFDLKNLFLEHQISVD